MAFDWRDYLLLNIQNETYRGQLETSLDRLAQTPEGQQLIAQAAQLSGPIQIVDNGNYSINGTPMDPQQHRSQQGNARSPYAQTFEIGENQFESVMYLPSEYIANPANPSITEVMIHELYHFADPSDRPDTLYRENMQVIRSYTDALLANQDLTDEQRMQAADTLTDQIATEIGVTEEARRENARALEYRGTMGQLREFDRSLARITAPSTSLDRPDKGSVTKQDSAEELTQAGGDRPSVDIPSNPDDLPTRPMDNSPTNASQTLRDPAALLAAITEQTGIALDASRLRALGDDRVAEIASSIIPNNGPLGWGSNGIYEENAVDYTDAFMAKYFGQETLRGDYRKQAPPRVALLPELVCTSQFPSFATEPVELEGIGVISAPAVGSQYSADSPCATRY